MVWYSIVSGCAWRIGRSIAILFQLSSICLFVLKNVVPSVIKKITLVLLMMIKLIQR